MIDKINKLLNKFGKSKLREVLEEENKFLRFLRLYPYFFGMGIIDRAYNCIEENFIKKDNIRYK